MRPLLEEGSQVAQEMGLQAIRVGLGAGTQALEVPAAYETEK